MIADLKVTQRDERQHARWSSSVHLVT